MSTSRIQLSVFWHIIKKELYILKRSLSDKFIDGAIVVASQVLVFGYLLPLIGMPIEIIAPTFIGTIIQLCFSIGYGLSLRLVFDLEHTRFIDYYLTLPVHKHWVFAVYLTHFVIEVAITTLPLFSLGIIALGKNFVTVAPNLPLFFIVYIASLILMASIFLACSFRYSFKWFFDNLWPRRLSPFFLLSSVLFPWKKVYAISHILGILFLCNPFTYVAESIRSTLIGGPAYISATLCLPMLMLFTGISWLIFKHGVAQRLDPV